MQPPLKRSAFYHIIPYNLNDEVIIMIKIFGMPATRSTRALWALEEAGAEYEFIKVDLKKGEGKEKTYLELNPTGKIPTLADGDLILTESAAICTYIGDQFPDSKLTPPFGTSDRALYDQWCFFLMTELEQPLWNMSKHQFALPKEFRIHEMQKTATFELEKMLDVFSARLGVHEFLVSEHFTCADILAASILQWARGGGKRIRSLQHENSENYLDRMVSRKAVLQVVEREKI